MDKRKGQEVIGVDIDGDELKRAPAGAYDATIVSDIGGPELKAAGKKADLVICQVVLEHVNNNRQAIENIAILTKRGGTISLFVPSRNALFARINLLLPQRMKEKLIYGLYPESAHAQGFPAYYDHCTANQLIAFLEKNNCTIDRVNYYYQGNYFRFFVVAHILWRFYQGIAYLLLRDNSADYLCIIATRK